MAVDTEKATRGPTAIKRLFRVESSEELQPRSANDVTHVVFETSDGQKIERSLADYFGGQLPAPCVGRAAAAFGINVSAGNAANTLKMPPGQEKTPEDLFAAIEDRLEKFDAGRWTSEAAERGPRTTLMMEAIYKWRSDRNADVSPEKMEQLRKALVEIDGMKQKWMITPGFAEVYEAIRSARKKPLEIDPNLEQDMLK